MQLPKTVLVVDENFNSRHLLCLRLEDMGFKILEAERAEQVEKALAQEKVDVVIADWGLADLRIEELLGLLEPEKRPVLLFTDRVVTGIPEFLKRTRVKAVVAKTKRYELLMVLVKLLDLIPPSREPETVDPDLRTAVGDLAHDPRVASSGAKHILVVEDSKAIRLFIRRALEKKKLNCVISEAEDGMGAIYQIGKNGVDVVVTDLEMPGMDGRKFLRQMRETPHLKNVPVLILSACSLRELKEEFKQDTHLGFLLKPSSAEQILEALKPFLGEEMLVQPEIEKNYQSAAKG